MKCLIANYIRLFLISIVLLSQTSISAQSIDWNIGQKVVASNRSTGDLFGWATAISGNTAMVGAYAQDVDSAGLNSMPFAGALYFFEYDSASGWVESQIVSASDRDTTDWFGREMAISGDYAIISAPLEDEDASNANTLSEAGSAYIFERNSSGKWVEVQKIVANDRHSGDHFGHRVDILGNYAIIGAQHNPTDSLNANSMTWAGAAYIFKRNGAGNWLQVQKIQASTRRAFQLFGSSVSIFGEWAVVGAIFDNYDVNEANSKFQAGSAYLYKRNAGGQYVFQQKITANDRDTSANFGYSATMSGDYAAIGAYYEDFDSLGSNETENAGAVYVFKRNISDSWILQQKLSPKHPTLNGWFGEDLEMDGDRMVIGSLSDTKDFSGNTLFYDKGTASIFEKNATGKWVLNHKAFSRDGFGGHHFARSVALSGTSVVAGNQFQSYDQNGTNFISNAGAAYIFDPCFTTFSPIDTNYICEGDSMYYLFSYRSTAGLHLDTVESYLGCDSVIRMELIHKPRPAVDSAISASRCGPGSVQLSAFVSHGNPIWYKVPVGGINFFTGNTYTTPSLSADTTFYIGGFFDGCALNVRTPITASILPVPSITSTTADSTCDSGMVVLSATASGGTLNWFTASTGGINLGSGSPFTTPMVYTTTGFYVETTDSNCTSARTAVPAFVFPTPTINTTMGSSTCDSGSMSLNATISAGSLKWFANASGGPVLANNSPFSTPIISSTTSYYAEAAANGCVSSRIVVDAVVLNSTYNTFNDTACFQYVSPSGISILQSGTYGDTITNGVGCDSILTIHLVVHDVDTSVVREDQTLSSQDSVSTYQWIDCASGLPVIGETNKTFAPNDNGNYAVVVTNNGCSDTSNCMEVLTIGLELNVRNAALTIRPNPTTGSFALESSDPFKILDYTLRNSTGQVVSKGSMTNGYSAPVEITGAPGMYFLEVRIDNIEVEVFKVVKKE